MNIAPWVPPALELGSLVSSGVGSWLDSRDKRNYQNKIARMQEDARKRAADAERIAIQRANRLSLLTGQTVRPEPIDIDLPVVPGYEPGTATRILKGLGFGLGSANLASSTVLKAQEYNTKLAEKAAEQQAAMDIMGAMTNQPAVGDLKYGPEQGGQWYTLQDKLDDTAKFGDWSNLTARQQQLAQEYLEDKYTIPTYTSGDVLTKTLGDFRHYTPEKALENLRNNPENQVQFDGLFSGDAARAFKGSYSKVMAGAYDTYKQQELAQLGQEAKLELQAQQLQYKRMADLRALSDQGYDRDISASDRSMDLLKLGSDMTNADKVLQSQRGKLTQVDMALNLVQASIGEPWIHKKDPITGEVLIDPITKKPTIVQNEASGYVWAEDGTFDGYEIKGVTADALLQMYQRGLDDSVVHAYDITRIQASLDTWFQTNLGQPLEAWYERNFGENAAVGQSPQPISPEAMLRLISILDTNSDHLRGQFNSSLDNIIGALQTENVLQNVRGGGIYTWNSVSQFQRDLATRIKGPYQDELRDLFEIPKTRADMPLHTEWQAQRATYLEAGRNAKGNLTGALQQKELDTEDPDLLELFKPVAKWDEFATGEGLQTETQLKNYWDNAIFKNDDAEPLNVPFANDIASGLAPYTQDSAFLNFGKIGSDIAASDGYLRRRAGVDRAINFRDGLFPGLARALETTASVPIIAGQQLTNSAAAGANLLSLGTQGLLRNYRGSTVRNFDNISRIWGGQ